MAKINVIKFKLMYNGKVYPAGSFIDLPDDVAKRLASEAPGEFKVIPAVSADVDSGKGKHVSDENKGADDSENELPKTDPASSLVK